MINNIVTSIEQVDILNNLGIDPRRANMIWVKTSAGEDWEPRCIPYESTQKDLFYAYKPAWTLEDLIKILPERIVIEGSDGTEEAFLCVNHEGVIYETISYGYKNFLRRKDESLIDVAVRAIERLKERELM